MNQKSNEQKEHFGNYMAISKVLSLLKTLPCDSVEDMAEINCTRRKLVELQTQEHEKDMAKFRANHKNIILEFA